MALRAVGGSPAGHTRAARLLLPGAEACAAAASKNTLATGNMCVLNSAPAVTKKHYYTAGIPRSSYSY